MKSISIMSPPDSGGGDQDKVNRAQTSYKNFFNMDNNLPQLGSPRNIKEYSDNGLDLDSNID